MAELARLSNVTKDFSGVKALDAVNLRLESNEILALVGENGAGKSTLMKILSGVYPSGSFTGEIFIDGKPTHFTSPLDAEKSGIAIIHQELSSFPHLTVAENIFVGHWPTRFGLVDWAQLNKKALQILNRVGANCKPTDMMGNLSVGTQQIIEIAKALSRESRIIILDEPTSALTPKEVKSLFLLLKELKNSGHALVYISHKMEEIYNLTDRIVVLRDGKTVHTALTSELPEEKLISHMVGRSLDRLFPHFPTRELGDQVLKIENFAGKNKAGKHLFGPLSLNLRRGEILGFAGLLGAGRSEILQSLFGDLNIEVQGSLKLKNSTVKVKHPREALRHNLAFVGEDRKRDSLLPTRSLNENVSIARLASNSLLRWLNNSKEKNTSSISLAQMNTKMSSLEQSIQELSGGNQQKIILARALQTSPEIIILDEPTRGVDVGAKYEIYEIIFKLVQQGKSLLLVSSDLPELMALSDRIVVISEGFMTAEFNRSEFSETEIMKMAIKKVAREIS